jgi:hypothetical protein
MYDAMAMQVANIICHFTDVAGTYPGRLERGLATFTTPFILGTNFTNCLVKALQ